MAPLTNEDKISIKTLTLQKGWSVLRLMQVFLLQKWKKSAFCNLIKRIDVTS